MRIVLTGGGTVGHISPAIALARELQVRGHEVFFAGTPQGTEARVIPQEHIPFRAFEATGFVRSKPWTLVTSSARIMHSIAEAKTWLQGIGADVVVGFGSYASVPACEAAVKLGIPLVIHEQNSVMGMSNTDLSRKAAKVCLTYACAAEGHDIPQDKLVVTGNPVRPEVLQGNRTDARAAFGIPEDAAVLLVFGGSLGARHINQAVCALKREILSRSQVCVIHITGAKELESVQAALALSADEAKRWILFGYKDGMGDVYAASDAIVARAGASSLAEISALALPAILVPYPYATADHQTHNAEALVQAGEALLVPDAQLDSPAFSTALFSLLDDAALREHMRECALRQDTRGAVVRLADVVVNAAR